MPFSDQAMISPAAHRKKCGALCTLPTISVPHLNARATEAVQQRQCSFAAYAGDINNSRILRGYVRAWMSAAWAEFERVGLGQGMRESV